MARRLYSDIPKFKRVEASLREAVRSVAMVEGEIDAALSGRRTKEETALLNSIRDQVSSVRDNASKVLHRLYVEVDGLGRTA